MYNNANDLRNMDKEGKYAMSASVEFLQEYQRDELNSRRFPEAVADKYNIIACLKSVSDKQVYLVKGKTDGIKYIMKCTDAQSHENLEEEYRLHHTLSHEGLVSAVEFIKTEGRSYFIREYADGFTVTELVEMSKEGHLSETEAVSLVLQLCDILQYLHTQNPPVIHRDIKPDNIIVTKQGACKLIDFGISRRFQGGGEKDTVVMGTEYTAPPEQFGYKQTDARSDIYSIGILLFYMVTGNLTIKEIGNFEISHKLKKIIQKCSEFSPEERFETARQLKMKLMKCINHGNKKTAIYAGITGVVCLCLCFMILQFTLMNRHFREIKNELQIMEQNQEAEQEHITELKQEMDEILEAKSDQETSQDTMPVMKSEDTASITQAEGDPYVFTSSLIEAAVRHELGKGENDLITLKDLYNIKELYICGEQIYDNWNDHFVYGKNQYMTIAEFNQTGIFHNQGDITSLDDLKQMKNLNVLALYNQKISDLSPLKELKNLTCLGLGANWIQDVSALEGMPYLETLDLSGNLIDDSDLEYLKQLTRLTELDLGETGVADITAIKDMNLTSLSLYQNNMGDCKGLEAMTGLEKLIVSGVGAGMSDIGMANMIKLTNLKELRIMGGKLTDPHELTRLSNLNYLDLCSTNFENLEDLKGLNLTTLYFDNTQVKDLTLLKYFKDLISIGVANIPCEDFTPLSQLTSLRSINSNAEQANKIKELFGEDKYIFWLQ